MQFDLFEYSRDTGLRNDVFHALEQFDMPTAVRALTVLEASFPQDIALPGMRSLIAVLQRRDTAPFATHAELASMRTCLDEVDSIAVQSLERDQGRKWMARLWRESAVRAGNLAFLAQESQNHAAPLYLRAEEWLAAEKAVTTIASWRRIPASLSWMAQARYRQFGLAPSWPLLFELAWMMPSRFDELLMRLADPVLTALLKSFYVDFEGQGEVSELAWFPAWVLIERPAVAAHLDDLQLGKGSAPEQAALLLRELLGIERRGQHQVIVERRRRLQGLQPRIYAAYMKTR